MSWTVRNNLVLDETGAVVCEARDEATARSIARLPAMESNLALIASGVISGEGSYTLHAPAVMAIAKSSLALPK